MPKYNKSLPKKYVFILLVVSFFVLALFTCIVIGYFTSMLDEKNYYKQIREDLREMQKNPGSVTYKRIEKLINFGIFFIKKDMDKICVFKSEGKSRKKLMENLNSGLVKNMKPEFYADSNAFNDAVLFEPKGLFSSFGDAFSFRLLYSVMKVFNTIKGFTDLTDDEESFLGVFIEKDGVRLRLYEYIEERCKITERGYYFGKRKGIGMDEIMKHMMYRLFV